MLSHTAMQPHGAPAALDAEATIRLLSYLTDGAFLRTSAGGDPAEDEIEEEDEDLDEDDEDLDDEDEDDEDLDDEDPIEEGEAEAGA